MALAKVQGWGEVMERLVECEGWVEWEVAGGKWVVGYDCGHYQNGSRCRGRNLVHLNGVDVRWQALLHDGSDRLAELVVGLEDQGHLDGSRQGSLCRRDCV